MSAEYFSEKRPVSVGSARLARIIVADTITGIAGRVDLLDETINTISGPQGLDISRSVMNEYVGMRLDERVLRIPLLNISASELQGAMIKLLQAYRRLPEEMRPAFQDGLSRVPSRRM